MTKQEFEKCIKKSLYSGFDKAVKKLIKEKLEDDLINCISANDIADEKIKIIFKISLDLDIIDDRSEKEDILN